MAYSPPKRITVVISFLLLALGLFLIISMIWIPDIYTTFPVISIGDFSSYEVYMIIALALILLSWLLFFIGINYRGI